MAHAFAGLTAVVAETKRSACVVEFIFAVKVLQLDLDPGLAVASSQSGHAT